jgi:site-specific recombinase XerD
MRPRRRNATRQECAKRFECCEAYLAANKSSWTRSSTATIRRRIYQFYRWLTATKIDIHDLNAAHLEAYWLYLAQRGLGEDTLKQYRNNIHAFLTWAAASGWTCKDAIDLRASGWTCKSAIDHDIKRPRHPWLLEHVDEIAKPNTRMIYRTYVGEFYDWIELEGIHVARLTKEQLQRYERHLKTSVPIRSVSLRRFSMTRISVHLRWLYGRKLLETSPIDLGIALHKLPMRYAGDPLPQHAKKFLEMMAAHKRPATVIGHRSCLRHFYNHLRHHQLGLESFTRLDFEEYLASMHREGYAPQSRRHAIGSVQVYLSWLFECGVLVNDPEPIIRNFQRPRLPDYLPRNLPPNVDQLVQKMLEEKGDVVALALLLMRRTGIRIGDLIALTYDCLREDPNGGAYMKIPIGKLHKERVVPLDSATLLILKRVQALSIANNHGRKPEVLTVRPDGKHVAKLDYRLVLYEIDEVLRLDSKLSLDKERLVSHRLRHTYATTLLSAGLSLEAIKELLGHRSFAMTLRYAQVTPQKLKDDYLKAMAIVESQVNLEFVQFVPDVTMGKALDEVLARLRGKIHSDHSEKKQILALIRRIERVRLELHKID